MAFSQVKTLDKALNSKLLSYLIQVTYTLLCTFSPCRLAFTKAYLSFLDFLIHKLNQKAGSPKFATTQGLALFNQRKTGLVVLREGCTTWKLLKEKANTQQNLKNQARSVLNPNIAKDTEDCVRNWHLSQQFKSRMDDFTEVHKKCVKMNKAPTKPEYEAVLAFVSFEISVTNGERKSSAGNITNRDFFHKEQRYNVSLQ